MELNYKYTEKNEKLYSHINGISNSLIFLPDIYGPFIHHPLGYLINDPSFNGSIVYSRDLGNIDIQLMKHYKGRDYYMYQLEGKYTESYDDDLTSKLTKLSLVEDSNIKINLSITNHNEDKFVYTYILNNGNFNYYLLDNSSKRNKSYIVAWYVSPNNITLEGKYINGTKNSFKLTDSSSLIIGTSFSKSQIFSGPTEVYEYRYMFDLGDDNITLLLPAEGWKNEEYPEKDWTKENISNTLNIVVNR